MQKPFGSFLWANMGNAALKLRDMDLVNAFTEFGIVSAQEKQMAKEVETYIQK